MFAESWLGLARDCWWLRQLRHDPRRWCPHFRTTQKSCLVCCLRQRWSLEIWNSTQSRCTG